MGPISKPEAFKMISEGMLRRIKEGMAMKQREIARLNERFCMTFSKNAILEKNLSLSRVPTITPEILEILKEIPLIGFITPVVAFFEEMKRHFAKYQMFFEEDFGTDERFERVVEGYAVLKKDEEDCLAEIKNVKMLTRDHYELRVRHIALARGYLKTRLENINGRAPDLDNFVHYPTSCT